MAAARYLWFASALSLLLDGAAALEFYPYGPAFDEQLPQQNDVSSSELSLTVPIKFFGESYSSIFVNSNGLLSFLTEIPTFFSVQFPLNYPVIAPLYANADLTQRGHVYYRETQDPELLRRASERVSSLYPRLQAPFSPTSLFLATWVEVGYHPRGDDKVNTFQAVVISSGTESFVELLYRQGGIQWVTGQSAGVSGLPDARAQAGFVAEDGRLYTLRGSGTDQIQNLDRWSNTDEPGAWMFRVGDTGPTGNVEPPQVSSRDSENAIEDNSCRTGAIVCHSRASCVDLEDSFCCVCQPGNYGNGRTCLQDQIPIRVNGKLSVSLNEEAEQSVDIQAYVVTADGRSYTALSRVPPALGPSAQLITATSDLIGWLFAKSIGDAPNGYKLTGGVLNHTAVLTFSGGQHRATVEQRFLGLDVFDQLRVEGRVIGTVPPVANGVKLNLPDSQSQFHRVSKGVFESQSSYVIHVENSPEQYPISLEQTISFSEFCPLSASESNFRLKAARSYISYEQTENILRFAATNKISSSLDNDDPCVVGHVSCVNNSHCIPDGYTFRCVCNNGFQTLYSDDGSGDYGCVDINECQSGAHSCAENALCINEIGSFTCQCRQGYYGNGYTCVPEVKRPDCLSLSCAPGADCVDDPSYGPRCFCVPGFTGDGHTCTPSAEDDCLICSPHAWCNHTETGAVQCTCLPSYHGDGRECLQADATPKPKCLLGSCWCPADYRVEGEVCLRDPLDVSTLAPPTPPPQIYDESDIFQHPEPECFSPSRCVCPMGYVLSAQSCVPRQGSDSASHFTKGHSGNPLSCNTVNNCHPNAQCIYLASKGAYECQCKAGFEGDGYDCSEIEISCKEADICHLYANCVDGEDGENAICVCYDGYQGDGTNCYKTDICSEDTECGDHASCMWSEDTNRKECECNPGYVLDYKICVKQGCDQCHEDAECVTNPATGLPQCVCRSGLVGDGIDECKPQPTGCNLLDSCSPDAQCVYVSPEAGYRCQCKVGFEGNGQECRRVNTCLNEPSICDSHARCAQTSTGFECQCESGFVGNGLACREVRPMEGGYLLVNKGMATVRVPMEPNRSNPGRPIQLQYDQTAIGLAVDCVEGLVYWSDIGDKVIKRSSLSGKDVTEFIEEGIESPEGLAVDWVARQLYWTDSGLDVIKSADLDSGEAKTIVSSGLVNARGIAVHPTLRKVFWTDWNRLAPKLEWSNLDGSNREVLVNTEIQLPNSLAIDWTTHELCWTDAGSFKIECLGLDTNLRRTAVSNCSYPFGLTITADKYYWTDWNTQKIESAFKFSPDVRESLVVPLGGEGKLYGITAVSDSCPPV